MSGIAHCEAFLGLDYHSTSIQVCVLDGHGKVLGNRSVDNDVAALRAYVAEVADGRVVRGGALEACCGAANLAERLRAFEWDICLAHAGLCSRMKQNPDKTDFSDAHLLADLMRVGAGRVLMAEAVSVLLPVVAALSAVRRLVTTSETLPIAEYITSVLLSASVAASI